MGDINEIVRQEISNYLFGVHTATIGEVQEYDPAGPFVSVRPVVRQKFADGDDRSFGILDAVPVVFPRGGSFSMTFPIKKGDKVLLVFGERSLDDWLEGSGNEVSVSDPRRFDLSDAIAIPGIQAFGSSSPVDNENDVEIKFGSGSVTIEQSGKIIVNGSAIELGSGLLKKLITETFVSLFNAHLHTGGTISGNTGPPTVPIVEPILSTVLTSKTKAE